MTRTTWVRGRSSRRRRCDRAGIVRPGRPGRRRPTRPSWPRPASGRRLRRSGPGSNRRSAASPAGIDSVGTTRTGRSDSSTTWSHTGTMFSSFGRSTTVCAPIASVDGLEDLRRRGIERGSAGEHTGRPDRQEALLNAVTRGDRHDRHPVAVPGPELGDLLHEVRDEQVVDLSCGSRGLHGRFREVRVDVTHPVALPLDHDGRIVPQVTPDRPEVLHRRGRSRQLGDDLEAGHVLGDVGGDRCIGGLRCRRQRSSGCDVQERVEQQQESRATGVDDARCSQRGQQVGSRGERRSRGGTCVVEDRLERIIRGVAGGSFGGVPQDREDRALFRMQHR